MCCFWQYEGLVKKIITQAKYDGYFDMLGEIGQKSWELMDRPEFFGLKKFMELDPVVMWVPMHKKRLVDRGFNQAEILAKSFAEQFGLETVGGWLVKTKETDQQVGKTREERLKNLKGAFECSISNIRYSIPKNVLLVDDVWTTGATLTECAKVLRQGGVKKVWGLVLAR
jgi:ComF family protein